MEKTRFKQLMTDQGYTTEIIDKIWNDPRIADARDNDELLEEHIREMGKRQQFKLALYKFAIEEKEKLEAKLN